MEDVAHVRNYDDYSFFILSVQSGLIKILFDTLKDVLTEVVIRVDETGILISQVNFSKTVLAHVKLVPTNFEVFVCNKPRDLGMNLTTFFNFLKFTKHSDSIALYQKQGDSSSLGTIFENSEKETFIESSIKLLSLDTEILNVPNIKFDTAINMSTTEFQNICKKLASISKFVAITVTNNKVRFSGTGDSGSISMDISGSGGGHLSFKESDDENKTATGVFCLKHILPVSKSSNLCNTVSMFLTTGSPVVLKYNVANLGSAKYLVCPIAE
jgi:proliferating cell nuclear antigen